MLSKFYPPPFPGCDFPTDVLRWMKKNAKPKMGLKLMKCHKCFQHFPEFPYLVVTKIEYDLKKWHNWGSTRPYYRQFKDIEDVTKKIWITKRLCLKQLPCITSILIPKMIVCDIKYLCLTKQKISFVEFEFLISGGNVAYLDLNDTTIKYENGEPVFLNSILECLPNAKKCYFYNNETPYLPPNFADTFKTIKNGKLEKLYLDFSSYANFEIFFEFMKFRPFLKYEIHFNDDSLNHEQTEIIKKYVQSIIRKGITKYPPPIICFPGQCGKQYDTLKSLYNKFKELQKPKNKQRGRFQNYVQSLFRKIF